jgi:hypothetical protein
MGERGRRKLVPHAEGLAARTSGEVDAARENGRWLVYT